MPSRRRHVARPRLAWPEWVRLDAPPCVVGRKADYGTPARFWSVGWRRWAGGLTLAPLRTGTAHPANFPLLLLIKAPADCDDVWASLYDGTGFVRAPCKVSPVTVVPESRHDPDAGLYYPPLLLNLILGG